MERTIATVTRHSRIDGVIPGVRGQRAFPTAELTTIDPFVMLDHIGPQKVAKDYFVDGASGAHPHRGFETITFMFEGAMNHIDSLGNKELLAAGSVQRMNAGKGIIHGGDFAGDKILNTFHEVQLWVNLPASKKLAEPDIHNASRQDIPVITKGNTRFRIIAGEIMGTKGPINTTANTKIIHTIGSTEKPLHIDDLATTYNLFVYVLKGNYEINGTPVNEFQTIHFNNDGTSMQFKGSGELLIVAGEPLNEPVVTGGPFVMNTEEEIKQAYTDFKNGLFGTI